MNEIQKSIISSSNHTMPQKRQTIQRSYDDIIEEYKKYTDELEPDDENTEWIDMIIHECDVNTDFVIHPDTKELCKSHPEYSNYFVGTKTGKVYQRNVKTNQLRKNPVSLYGRKSTLSNKLNIYASPVLITIQDKNTKKNINTNYIQFVADTFYENPQQSKKCYERDYRLVIKRTTRTNSLKPFMPYCPPEILGYSNRPDHQIFNIEKDDPYYRVRVLKYYNASIFSKNTEKNETDDDE
jgi:hypothetical protein